MGTTFEYLLDFWRPEKSLFALGSNSVRENATDIPIDEPHAGKSEDEGIVMLNDKGKARSVRTKKKESTEASNHNEIFGKDE